MTYASKLPLTCNIGIVFDEQSPLLGEHVFLKDGSSARLVRRRLRRTETAAVLAVLPVFLRKHCLGMSKSSIGVFGPHVHTKEGCTLNFYYKTGGETTVFYSDDYEIDSTAALDNGNSYQMVRPMTEEAVLSFTANDGEVWLLDTKKPHAVVGECVAPRRVLQVHMALSYVEVLRCFTDGGSRVL